ncbi:MAG: 23S rRNA (guanosine(2251)-2'-O)-methyltransferase RlmB [Planctomycetaceae bacterium]
MVGRRPRRKESSGKGSLAGSHAKCWLWGRHAVQESLAAGRWLPLEVTLRDDGEEEKFAEIIRLATDHGLPLSRETAERLTQWTGSREHQGVVARMPEFPYLSPADLLSVMSPTAGRTNPKGQTTKPIASDTGEQQVDRPERALLYVLLDRIQDPHNFGAILRSAEVLGADAVFVGREAQSPVTPHVARSSAGAVHYIPLVQVESLTSLLDDWNRQGVQTLGTTGTAQVDIRDCDLTAPTALVLGNEGVGVRDELLSRCQVQARIPQQGQIESLNAAVAAGIVLYEASRQRSR